MADNVIHNNGIGLAGWLGILFITLKLCGVISWPWIWVLAPFWIGLVIVLLFLVAIPLVGLAVAGLVGLIAWVIGLIFRNRK